MPSSLFHLSRLNQVPIRKVGRIAGATSCSRETGCRYIEGLEQRLLLAAEIKWDQPPVVGDPQNLLLGWNEPSLYKGRQIAADDFVCKDNTPITGVVWWGSFVGWTEPDAAPVMPSSFHLSIWTDTPAGADSAFSHPEKVVWEADVRNVDVQFVGWDYDPRNKNFDAGFRFSAALPREDWFIQDSQLDTVFWLSIAAVYPSSGEVIHPFGWKTRPRDPKSPAPDDAVRVKNPTPPSVIHSNPVSRFSSPLKRTRGIWPSTCSVVIACPNGPSHPSAISRPMIMMAGMSYRAMAASRSWQTTGAASIRAR